MVNHATNFGVGDFPATDGTRKYTDNHFHSTLNRPGMSGLAGAIHNSRAPGKTRGGPG
jgi:hypothetical protein